MKIIRLFQIREDYSRGEDYKNFGDLSIYVLIKLGLAFAPSENGACPHPSCTQGIHHLDSTLKSAKTTKTRFMLKVLFYDGSSANKPQSSNQDMK